MGAGDLPHKRAPGAADEGTPGAEEEPGVGQEPGDVTDAESAEEAPDEGVASRIDIEEIRPDVDREEPEES